MQVNKFVNKNLIGLCFRFLRKFKEIDTKKTKTHPVINKENTIKRFLSKFIKPFVSAEEYYKLIPSGSQPGKIYGLCIVHKEGQPLRPVVSMLSTAEYNIAKYLDSIIKPCIPNHYMLNSTKRFGDMCLTI